MEYTLQNLQFPNPSLCERRDMYYRLPSGSVDLLGERSISFPEGGRVLFNTYFNSFSIGKWRKYTKIDNLNLKLDCLGHIRIRFYISYQINGGTRTKTIDEIVVNCEKRECVIVPISTDYNQGIISFSLTSVHGVAYYYGGSYITYCEPSTLNNTHIGIAICTYKREKYILSNISDIASNIIDNDDSPMRDKLDIFVSDNSQTLPESTESEHIHIFKNRNLGGAGGFARAMIEIMKVRDEQGITHILMMDDDVRISCETILKTYSFISLIKPEYMDAFIGGHMLKLNQMNIQSEAADYFNKVTHSAVKRNYNLEKVHWIVRNEIEDPVNYLSWWYCCMPVGIVNDDNLPIPVFIKRDDIEYGLRNGNRFITLNGICVWHEEFAYKSSSYLEYYYYRNLCIMLAKRKPNVTKEEIWEYTRKKFEEKLNTYKYKEAELILIGINDFLKGIDWLMAQDGVQLNNAIMALGYRKEPIESLHWDFAYGKFASNLNPKYNRKQKLIRKFTRNGRLLPANKEIVVNLYRPKQELFYRARRVLNYEDYSKTGFITYKDTDAKRLLMKYYKETKKNFLSHYDSVAGEYASRFNEITNLRFWNDYLYKEGETPEYQSVLSELRPANTKKQKHDLNDIRKRQALQHIQSMKHVVNNRITFDVHRRMGLTCNPKYIALEIVKKYGNAFELYWVTDYPDSCEEVASLGLSIIKRNSDKHFEVYETSKVYVTNDCFPAWAIHKKNQLWINAWHGAVNYKHIGFKSLAPRSKISETIYRFENRQPDYFIAGTKQFMDNTAEAFAFDKNIFIPCGLPRNDVFFGKFEDIKPKLKNTLNIKESYNKILLFAPTFRRGMKSSTYGLDFEALRGALSERFTGNWIILFRDHNLINKKGMVASEHVIDVSDYADMNELLLASDILISDYSSCMYDFTLQNKPCFVYAPDMDNYMSNDRSLSIPISEWPYPVATSNDDLIDNIRIFNNDDYTRKLDEHRNAVGCFDCGNASEIVADMIADFCGITSD